MSLQISFIVDCYATILQLLVCVYAQKKRHKAALLYLEF